ncbi:hypothetical protein [Acidisoma silvae]|uniref:Uncharacterized protein n=1 Tax=Acidisoma silvae TaxID=2802396 RepID=A0A963YNX4_9PROT|nr:hypothetical protein [Acidisoma silvae]MCB8874330.1 hypothetical protein [Acidisoma silvae]
MAEIDRIDLPQFVFQQWTAKRRTKSFGYLYDFRNADFGPTEPIPDFLMSARAIAADFAGVAALLHHLSRSGGAEYERLKSVRF